VSAAAQRLGDSATRPRVLERAGFTLIEVVVVLVLLGVVAGVTLPAFMRPDAGGPRAEVTSELLRLLESARATALERATTTCLVLDPASGSYRVEGDSAGQAVVVREGRVQLPANVTLMSDRSRVQFRFSSSGVAIAESLVVRGPDGASRVVVDRWTGLTRVE